MKTFRTWWEKCEWFFNCAVNGHWVERGWKAALKEVLHEIDTLLICDEIYDAQLLELKETIEKVLGE